MRVFLVVVGASVGAARGQPISAFLAEAERANVDARLAEEAQVSARATFDQRWGALLPTLSANGGYTRNQFEAVAQIPSGPTSTQRIVIAPFDQWEATLKAELPLIDVSKWVAVGAAAASAEAAAARTESSRLQVKRQVIAGYYAYAGALALRDSAHKSLSVAKAQAEEQVSRSKAGVATELEVTRAVAEVERTTQVVADAEAQVATSRRTLRSLSGLEPSQPVTLPSEDVRSESPLEQLEERAAGLPAVEAAERDAVAASRTWTAAAAALAPSVTAQFTQRFTNATGFQNQPLQWNTGVGFTWRGDFGSLAGLRVARASEQTAVLQVEKVRQGAVDQIHSDWHRVVAAQTKVKAAKAQIQSARRAQSLAKERQAAGVSTQLDVIQADRDVFAAEVNDVQARFELATARASLRLSAGLPLEE